MQKFTIGKNDADQRVDKYLTKKFPDMPSGILYKGIRKKRIKVNGKKCDISTRLLEGDIIELYINDEFLSAKTPVTNIFNMTPKINIIYEDSNIILLDKEPGVSVHPDSTESEDTLIANVQAYLYLKEEYNPKDEGSFSPALCNRIDKNTGGIVIAAKNAMTLRTINQKIKNHEITKKYLCVVHGRMYPYERTMTAYHIKDTRQNKAYIYDEPVEGSKEIKTKYKVLKNKSGLSLVEVELLTGKTHQIRAHFAHIGHPLAGDTKYGTNEQNKGLPFKYQALYSYKIRFDFTEPSPLDYLNRKEFTVPEVPFKRYFV